MTESLEKSINNLVGTFTKITGDTNNNNLISNESVCIDTSNNRIGINTLDPSYSIHVLSGDICTDNSLISQTISCETINTNILNVTNINISGNISGQLDFSTNVPTFLVRDNSNNIEPGNIYVDPSGFLKIKF